MTDPTTPGAIAYGMYQRRLHNLTEHIPLDYPRPFSTLSAAQRAAWEAAAQAVLDHADVPPLDLTLREEDTPDV